MISYCLNYLTDHYYVAIISGGKFEQFETQVLSKLKFKPESNYNKLHLFPTCGAQYYKFENNSWTKVYSKELTQEQKEKITNALYLSIKQSGVEFPEILYGNQLEDRLSQLTFSALGQKCPAEIKKDWDPDFVKRTKIANILRNYIPEFEVKMGGHTSLDITLKGIDKQYGLNKIKEYLGFDFDEMIFVGDCLSSELGNDYPARLTGVDCIETSGPYQTEEIIKNLIAIKVGENKLKELKQNLESQYLPKLNVDETWLSEAKLNGYKNNSPLYDFSENCREINLGPVSEEFLQRLEAGGLSKDTLNSIKESNLRLEIEKNINEPSQTLREKILNTIPKNYNYLIHLLIPSFIAFISVLLSVIYVQTSKYNITVIPLTVLFFFGFEWFVHKFVLHKKTRLFKFIYDQHIKHHCIYNFDNMALKSFRELYLILMPTYSIVLAFLGMIPICLLFSLISADVSLLILSTSMCFFLFYEWSHFTYHLPEDSFVFKSRLIKFLQRNHKIHHDPKNMNKYNFNVTFPIFDYILRSKK
jgi:hypothetical protein